MPTVRPEKVTLPPASSVERLDGVKPAAEQVVWPSGSDGNRDCVAELAPGADLRGGETIWSDGGGEREIDLPEAGIAGGGSGVDGSNGRAFDVHDEFSGCGLVSGGASGIVGGVGAAAGSPEDESVARMGRGQGPRKASEGDGAGGETGEAESAVDVPDGGLHGSIAGAVGSRDAEASGGDGYVLRGAGLVVVSDGDGVRAGCGGGRKQSGNLSGDGINHFRGDGGSGRWSEGDGRCRLEKSDSWARWR